MRNWRLKNGVERTKGLFLSSEQLTLRRNRISISEPNQAYIESLASSIRQGEKIEFAQLVSCCLRSLVPFVQP